MRNLIILLCCLTCLTTFAQTPKVEFDGHKWNPPYTLAIPEGWGVERFLIPIEFAPQIPYKGVEDIRFTPGWGNVKSDEYWSYAFLWYLEGSEEMNEGIIESNLKAYYSGLIQRNIEPRKIPVEKVVPVKTEFKKVKTEKGDLKTFQGTIGMLDYMEQKPMMLNCIVHVKSCSGQNKTYIFNELSPKPYSDNIWKSLNQLWTGFNCDKVKEVK
jgi:hypothetical protein